MSNNKDNIEDIKLELEEVQELEDFTVDDAFEMVEEQEQERISRREKARIRKHNKMKKKRRIKIVLLVLEIFVVLMLGLVATFLLAPKEVRNSMITCGGKCAGKITGLESKFNEKYNDDKFDEEKVNVNPELDTKQYEDYITIALFGIDSRDNSLEVGLSDSIIIATINTINKEVRMSSIYRDTFLSIVDADGDTTLNKINSAFNIGGVELALTNLNRNLDISIDEYAVVNFAGLATIIDAFGGIDVNITPDEKYYINGYLVETREVTGLSSPDVYDSGYVHLNGLQATAFCRIRYCSFTDEDGSVYNDDFGRTARQRFVIRQLISKAKQLGVDNVVDIANELFGASQPAFKTSMSYEEIMELLPIVLEFSLAGTEGFPYTMEGQTSEVTHNQNSVVAQGLTYNVTKLHEFLYPTENYKPTTTLKNISNEISFRTGVEEVKLPEDQ